MNRIIEYILVSHGDLTRMMEEVNKLIREGFQPFGSVSSSYAPDEQRFYMFQAMVKFHEASIAEG
jgi:hypothetical protein